MRRLRLGVIGLGAIAQIHHLPTIQQLHDQFELGHVCDLSSEAAESVGARYGAPRRSIRWQDVCEDATLDAVLLLHSGSHGAPAKRALENGLHVLSEKPLCYTVREADELADAARATNTVLQVAYMKSHEAVMAQARREVEALGELRLVRHCVRHPSETAQQDHLSILRFADQDPVGLHEARRRNASLVREAIGDVPAGLAWLYEELALGSIVHYLAVFRSLLGRLPGRIRNVDAWPFSPDIAPSGWGPTDRLPTLSVFADLDDGCRLDLTWVWLESYPQYAERIEVLSPRGAVEMAFPPPYLHHRSASLVVTRLDAGVPIRHSVDGGFETAFSRELRDFHTAIVGSGQPLSGVAEAQDDTAWCQRLITALGARHGFRIGGEAARFQEGESITRESGT